MSLWTFWSSFKTLPHTHTLALLILLDCSGSQRYKVTKVAVEVFLTLSLWVSFTLCSLLPLSVQLCSVQTFFSLLFLYLLHFCVLLPHPVWFSLVPPHICFSQALSSWALLSKKIQLRLFCDTAFITSPASLFYLFYTSNINSVCDTLKSRLRFDTYMLTSAV